MEDRPPASAAKLLNQFNDWVAETEMPGRTMAYLKTGMLHEVLAAQADAPNVSAMIESWNGWEKGGVRPEVVLEVLSAEGIVDLLMSLSSP
jgi:hypothetical protein